MLLYNNHIQFIEGRKVMITENQATSLKRGSKITITNHFRKPELDGREVVFEKISPRKGYVKGYLVLFNGSVSTKETRYRLTDIKI
ncbi:MAG: hypothetical protein K0R18_516 [Bacillales bacterium]|jgi:hypothetical protein|nr:hypothetical protein [Bacillales bacterium]